MEVVYTMDYEVVPRSYKICAWLLNSSWDHFVLHLAKKCGSDYGIQGLQKIYFKAYIIHWHGPTGFVLREAKELLWLEKKRLL